MIVTRIKLSALWTPRPGATDVRVEILAVGVSAYDLMHRRSGMLPGTPKPP